MNNSEQIRTFFRNLADGRIINANDDRLEMLHNTNAILPRNRKENIDLQFVPSSKDFGVGLPPLANC